MRTKGSVCGIYLTKPSIINIIVAYIYQLLPQPSNTRTEIVFWFFNEEKKKTADNQKENKIKSICRLGLHIKNVLMLSFSCFTVFGGNACIGHEHRKKVLF